MKLFTLMLDKALPGRLVKVVADWYGKTASFVKWNGCYSESCVFKSGIRQGGILLPALFNIYTDVLLNALQESDYSCHLGQKYVGCIAYADDIIVLSASISGLQCRLNICYNKGAELYIIFNADKSCLYKISKICNKPIDDLVIGDEAVKWFDKLKYLGLHFCCHKQLIIDIYCT